MNAIRSIQALNKRELENVVPSSASWHTDYRDTAYVFIGGLPLDLTEGDVVTIFSQFGEPTWIKLQRDKETGKSKGFAFLKYEDQRSTDLAVDNLGGATVLGRMLRVDHTRYKRKEGEEEEEERGNIEFERELKQAAPSEDEGVKKEDQKRKEKARVRRLTTPERELQEIIDTHDDEDPMKEYLISEKRKEITEAERRRKEEKREHHHRRRHRERDRDRSSERDRRHGRDRHDGRPEREKRDRGERSQPE